MFWFITLMKEPVNSFETMVSIYHITRCNISGDSRICNSRCENFNPYLSFKKFIFIALSL
jgi:hypothetical protein